MFAVRNNFNITPNAGRELALTLQAFFMSAYFVVLRYWYSCTPVYRLNGRTAFGVECVTQRDRHGYLFLLLCVIFNSFPTLQCVAATERQPAKTAHSSSTRTYSVRTMQRANADASLRLHRPCASSSLSALQACIRTSAKSRYTIPAFSSLPVCGCTEAELSTSKHIPYRTSTDFSVKKSARYSHNYYTLTSTRFSTAPCHKVGCTELAISILLL